MKGHCWKSKLIMMLIVYFAGFASAIYCLMPAPDAKASKNDGFAHSALRTDEFAKSFNVNMYKFMRYSNETAKRFSAYVKEKRAENRQTAKANDDE